jgi:rare lipoprotein A
MVLVTCLERGKSVVVRITDRLPSKRAIIDLTQKAAAQLNMLTAGRTRVKVQVLTKEQAQALREAAKDAPLALSAATELLTTALTEDSR